MDLTSSIGNAGRIRMLADGLRDAGAAWSHRVHMEVWPIFNGSQVKRIAPDVTQFAKDLQASRQLLEPGAGVDDAVKALQELEDFALTKATGSRRHLRHLGDRAIATADRLDELHGSSATDAATLGRARGELYQRMQGGAADLTMEEATALLPSVSPVVAGGEATRYLGLASSDHASEFARTLHKIARGDATTADRERLALIELVGRGTPEADEQLRSIALTIFETDPKDLRPAAWNRLATMLDVDSTGRVLDGPRRQGGSARDLQDLANYMARRLEYSGRPARTGAVTKRYFEQWRDAIAKHPRADGTPVVASPRDPNVERMFQVKPPEARQLVADLGRVGASSFRDIEDALRFAEVRLDDALAKAPELQQTVTETKRLIQLNIDRLAGHETTGYGRHPDYAELGRVRSNIELADKLVASKLAAAERAAAPTGQATADGGKLTW